MHENRTIPRILRLHEVTKAVGISKASIYRLMKQNKFPRNFKVGLVASGWDLVDIELWLFERKLESTTINSIH